MTIGHRPSSIAKIHCTSPPDANPTSCCRSFPRRKLPENKPEETMKRAAALVLTVFVLVIFTAPGWAQTYPRKNVTIIVPYPAGGPTDQVARVLAQARKDKLKQTFMDENVRGGAPTIAPGGVAHAAPDGYTLLIHNLQISANVA